MEIVGLLIIVVLIILIIFFSLTFKTQPNNTSLISFQDMKMASQLGIVITETTVTCGTRTRKLRELIIDCASYEEINCDSKNSCVVLNETIEQILNYTLELNTDYALTINKIGGNEFITNFVKPKCERPRSVETISTPIGNTRGPITLTIKLCS